jgi:hypothetical protein
MNAIGQHATQELQGRAKDLHGNVKGIEEQEKGLEAGVKGLRKERERLEKVVAEGGRVVKELGNVQNWAEVLERDFLVGDTFSFLGTLGGCGIIRALGLTLSRAAEMMLFTNGFTDLRVLRRFLVRQSDLRMEVANLRVRGRVIREVSRGMMIGEDQNKKACRQRKTGKVLLHSGLRTEKEMFLCMILGTRMRLLTRERGKRGRNLWKLGEKIPRCRRIIKVLGYRLLLLLLDLLLLLGQSQVGVTVCIRRIRRQAEV